MIMQQKQHASHTRWIQTVLIVTDILNWSIASMSYSEQLWHTVNVWTSVRTCSESRIQKQDRVHWSSVLQICQSTCGWDAKTFTRPRGLPQCVWVCKFTISLQKNNSTSLQPMTSLTYRRKEMLLWFHSKPKATAHPKINIRSSITHLPSCGFLKNRRKELGLSND